MHTKILITLIGITFGLCLYFYKYSYLGNRLGSFESPNKKYTIRVYSSYNPFDQKFTMPGDTTCRSVWLRLYKGEDKFISQKYSKDCGIWEGRVLWNNKTIYGPGPEMEWSISESSENNGAEFVYKFYNGQSAEQ